LFFIGDDARENDIPEHFENEKKPPTIHEIKNKKEIDVCDDANRIVFLSKMVIDWFRKINDNKLSSLAITRFRELELTAQDQESYKLKKGLKGGNSKQIIFEAKLDSGMRILYTIRYAKASEKETILAWYICKHDEVNRRKILIEQSFARGDAGLAMYRAMEFNTDEPTVQGDLEEEEEDHVYLNPHANVPLKEYQISLDEMQLLKNNWTPPVRLTNKERMVVEQDGTVSLLGRSGTGKTFCVCSRISLDRLKYPHQRQLFVARTPQLCNHIKNVMLKESASECELLRFHTASGFVKEMETLTGCETAAWPNRWFYSFLKFKEHYAGFAASVHKTSRVKNIEKRPENQVNSLTVWSQIRSFIKGSFDAVSAGKPLSLEEYLALGQRQCRLDGESRRFVYEMFLVYQYHLKQSDSWDEADKIMILYRGCLNAFKGGSPYDLIYVDEVQDMLQGEIALFVLATGKRPASLFLAGDTAQTIAYGVDFRFEDSRSVLYKMVPAETPTKPIRLRWNYRSHSGILNLAKDIIDLLTENFPFSMDKSSPDCGIVVGPRPEICKAYTTAELTKVLRSAGTARMLVQDTQDLDGIGWGSQKQIPQSRETIFDACKVGGFTEPLVLTIVQSKGLEFAQVYIVNFFADMSEEKNRAWKLMISDRAVDAVYPAIERDLKLLYTAITRCCSKLVFVETRKTEAADAYFKRLVQAELVTQYIPQKEASGSMCLRLSNDGWRVQGLELVVNADEADPLANIELAKKCFENAENSVLQARAQNLIHVKQLRTMDKEVEEKLQVVVKECMANGNFMEVLEALSFACPDPDIAEQRIKLLLKKLLSHSKTKDLCNNK